MTPLLFRIVLTVTAIQYLSGKHVTQKPDRLDVSEGDSALISCSFEHNIDIRGVSFQKASVKILQLCFLSNNKFNVSLSGVFDNLTCKFSTGDGSKCEVKTDKPKSPQYSPCSTPPENSQEKFLYRKDELFASICVDNGYTNRIDISSNVQYLNITLQQLTESDSGSFSCSGNATSFGEFTADSTVLTVNKGSIDTGTIIGIVIGVIVPVIFIALVVVYLNREKICSQNSLCRGQRSTSSPH